MHHCTHPAFSKMVKYSPPGRNEERVDAQCGFLQSLLQESHRQLTDWLAFDATAIDIQLSSAGLGSPWTR